MIVHASHQTRTSDASSFDEICELCGATDAPGGSLDKPCSMAQKIETAAAHFWRMLVTMQATRQAAGQMPDVARMAQLGANAFGVEFVDGVKVVVTVDEQDF